MRRGTGQASRRSSCGDRLPRHPADGPMRSGSPPGRRRGAALIWGALRPLRPAPPGRRPICWCACPGGYVPVVVVRHRITDPEGAVTSPLARRGRARPRRRGAPRPVPPRPPAARHCTASCRRPAGRPRATPHPAAGAGDRIRCRWSSGTTCGQATGRRAVHVHEYDGAWPTAWPWHRSGRARARAAQPSGSPVRHCMVAHRARPLTRAQDVSLVVRGEVAAGLRDAASPRCRLAGRIRGVSFRCRACRWPTRSPWPGPGCAACPWCAGCRGCPCGGPMSRWMSTWRASAKPGPTSGARC